MFLGSCEGLGALRGSLRDEHAGPSAEVRQHPSRSRETAVSSAPCIKGGGALSVQWHIQSQRDPPWGTGQNDLGQSRSRLFLLTVYRPRCLLTRPTCQRRGEVRTREGLGQLRFGCRSARLLMLVHTLTCPACLCPLTRRQAPDAAKALLGVFQSAKPRVAFTRRASMTPAFASLRPKGTNLSRSCGRTTNGKLSMSSSSAATGRKTSLLQQASFVATSWARDSIYGKRRKLETCCSTHLAEQAWFKLLLQRSNFQLPALQRRPKQLG